MNYLEESIIEEKNKIAIKLEGLNSLLQNGKILDMEFSRINIDWEGGSAEWIRKEE